MDIYSTGNLTKVVSSLLRPQADFYNRYFNTQTQSTDEYVYFDTEQKTPRISPLVHPLREGKLVESQGYKTDKFKPGYVKDKRILHPSKALKRRIGETIGGDMNPLDRQRANLVMNLNDQLEMLTRRMEVWSTEVIRTGKIVLEGDGFDQVELNFGRDAALTKVLAGAARWGEAGVSPWADLEAWSLEMLAKSDGGATEAVMGVEAWKLLRVDPDFEKKFEARRADTDAMTKTVVAARRGMQYMGTDGNLDYYVYTGEYVDVDGATKKYIGDYDVCLVGGHLEGERHFAAIQDEEAGIQAMEFFTKSWVKKDPSSRILLMQSAPLVVPYRPNASMCATVR